MKWLWVTALLFLVTGVKSGPPKRKVGVVDGTIKKIDRIDKGSTRPPDKFQFTLSEALEGDIIKLVLEVKQDGKPEVPVVTTNVSDLLCPTFDADLIIYSGEDANFLITALNKSGLPIAEANADLTPFPEFPGDTETTTLPDPRDTPNGTLVRVQGILEDMSLTSSGTLFQGDISYFEFPNISSANYFPCNNSNGVEVCDKELTHSVLTGKVDDPMVSSAVLAYGPDAKATIKLSFLNAGATHEAILIPQSLQSLQSPEKNVLCTDKQFTETTCTIDWSDSSITALQLIIIQKPTTQDAETDTWATSTFDIHDRQLAVTQLGADIIEGRWLMLDGEYSSDDGVKSIYRLQKTKTSTTPLEDQEIDVDCSHLALEPRLCFGYFPHVDPGTYTLTVAYKGTGDANEMDQIESSPVQITASKPELEILSRHTTTLQNQQRADVQICFQHLTPTEGRSFSHYEMLIINEKGQWLKHSIMQEEEEEESNEEKLCFASFNINTKDFDLTEGTKVIISQRGVDGVSVLASGESALF